MAQRIRTRQHATGWAAAAMLALALAAPAHSQTPPAPGQPAANLGLRLEREPKALELLQAMSQRLAAAKSMTFTAIATYESPARTGEPLAYTTLSEVTLQRPDKLRVVTPGDGPPSEFYYDGKVAMAYAPQEGLVAVAEVPPTIDAMLQAAYHAAALYFPFTDVILADPYAALAGEVRLAFVIGQSRVVGGVPTDIVAVATDNAHMQIWIGTEDKLPRMIRATFSDEPGHYRHVVEFSNWRLDPTIPADAFASAAASGAKRIGFARPDTAAPTAK